MRKSPDPTSVPGGAAVTPEHADIHLLDVRGLAAPEPLVRTLDALRALPWGHTLVRLDTRVPRSLLGELDRRDFTWLVVEESTDRVRVALRHAGPFPVVDVRLVDPPEKDAAVFRAFRALEPGAALLLVDDHDPVPLRDQLEAAHPDASTWAYLEEGPDLWRIRIRRTA